MKAFQLEDNEEVLLLVRRHWWVVLSETLFIVVLAILPIISYETALLILQKVHFDIQNPTALFTFFYSLWLLSLWVVFFLVWTDYYLDVWVITTKQIVDIEQKGLFNREISNLRMDRVQDTTVQIKGVLGTFFKFGNIIVQTAGDSKAFVIRDAHYPEHVKGVIQKALNKALDAPNATESNP